MFTLSIKWEDKRKASKGKMVNIHVQTLVSAYSQQNVKVVIETYLRGVKEVNACSNTLQYLLCIHGRKILWLIKEQNVRYITFMLHE